MGYTHGIQWTDKLISEKVLEVAHALELERMPSRKECEDYFGNAALASAISRRMGWYALAQKMRLPVKDSETYFGKRQEESAKEQLISRGFEVRRMSQNFPYDLLVNDCIKVEVKVSRLYQSSNGNFYSFNLAKPFCTCDMYMLYMVREDKAEKGVLIVPSKFVATNTQISVGETKSKYHRFLDRWDYLEEYSLFFESVG